MQDKKTNTIQLIFHGVPIHKSLKITADCNTSNYALESLELLATTDEITADCNTRKYSLETAELFTTLIITPETIV